MRIYAQDLLTAVSLPCVLSALPCVLSALPCVLSALPCVLSALPCVLAALPCAACDLPYPACCLPLPLYGNSIYSPRWLRPIPPLCLPVLDRRSPCRARYPLFFIGKPSHEYDAL